MKKLTQVLALCCLVVAEFISSGEPRPLPAHPTGLDKAKAMPFSGPGLNTHGQLLPVDKIKAIGIRWVRGDAAPDQVTEESVKRFLKHYRGMPVLWIIQQKTPDAPKVALDLIRWGVTDLELGNEPERPEFSPDGTAWTGARYGKWFAAIRKSVSGRARLYGPATGVYLPDFNANAIRAGMKADFISWHGYGRDLAAISRVYGDVSKRFGKQSINTEVGFGEGPNYPVKLHPADAFIAAKKLFGNRPWCYYDGPNGNADKRVGLFEWDPVRGNWEKVTETYRRIFELTEHPW